MPLKNEEKNAVTAGVLKILKETYDIEEEDFLSAELEIVPAGSARECRHRSQHDPGLRTGRPSMRLYIPVCDVGYRGAGAHGMLYSGG